MGKYIKGKDNQIRFLLNGNVVQAFGLNNFSVNQDADVTRHKHLGKGEDELDLEHGGWSGSCDIEKDSPAVDDFIDALVEGNLSRVGSDMVTIFDREDYRDGTYRAYVYGPCVVTTGKNSPGKDETTIQTLNWTATRRRKL